MIRCHFARMLGERKLKIADVSRDTGVNRGTLTRLYYETTERYESETLDLLCGYFGCAVGDLLEYVEGDAQAPAAVSAGGQTKSPGAKAVKTGARAKAGR